jgi:EPTP domain
LTDQHHKSEDEFIFILEVTMARRRLTEVCRIPASGARTVEPFEVDGLSLLAIPQLAYDVPGEPANMNGGDADTELLLLRRTADGYQPFQRLAAPGGEDAEFFRIGDRAFLATASVRTGHGPYEYATTSRVFEWVGGRFEPFQSFPGFAAKQWRHFTIDGAHFLALAQGIEVPGRQDDNRPSQIFRWTGDAFTPFQTIPSKWAYNWHAFAIDGEHYLAHADHVEPSLLYRWNGAEFVAHQQLASRHGRAFATFSADGDHYLLVGCLQSQSRLLRWDGRRFADHQTLDGLATREFAVIETPGALHVVRVNFILGTPADPRPSLDSQLYAWQDGRLTVAEEFPTTGAADVSVHDDAAGPLVFVANALTPEARFAAFAAVYRFN